MRKLLLPVFFALSALTLGGVAQAQTDPHAGHHPAAGAAAQAAEVRTTPADGWMGSTAPTAFSITFPHPMRLTAVSLKSGEAAPAAIAVTDAAPSTAVSVPLPAPAKGNHVLTWSAQGVDGHVMNGVVRFMVH